MIEKQWAVYRVQRRPSGQVVSMRMLGEVTARREPDAIIKAWQMWPGERDPSQVQDGFTVRRVAVPLPPEAPPMGT